MAVGLGGFTGVGHHVITNGHTRIAALADAPGRITEAHAIVRRFLGANVLPGDEISGVTTRHISTLFSARYWRRTAFNSLFFICLVVPWFVIYTWLPTISQTIGLEDALTASLILNGLLIVGALLGLVLTWSFSAVSFNQQFSAFSRHVDGARVYACQQHHGHYVVICVVQHSHFSGE